MTTYINKSSLGPQYIFNSVKESWLQKTLITAACPLSPNLFSPHSQNFFLGRNILLSFYIYVVLLRLVFLSPSRLPTCLPWPKTWSQVSTSLVYSQWLAVRWAKPGKSGSSLELEPSFLEIQHHKDNVGQPG